MTIDKGGPAGVTKRYREKLEQERGIPIWVRIGLEAPLSLVGWVDPTGRDPSEPAQVQLAIFFQDLANHLLEHQDGE